MVASSAPATIPYLGEREVRQRCDVPAAVAALERTLREGFDPEADPPRGAFPVDGGELLVMPSVASGHIAVKLLTIGGRYRVQGLCVLFDRVTLSPMAIVDGIALTALRTASVSALAVRHLATAEAHRLVVFGRGPQAHAHAEAIAAVRPVQQVDFVGRDHDAGLTAELVARADVVCCCTTARTPLFDGSLVGDHATVVAMGSHDPEARETDDALARRASVVVESRSSALREAGDVVGAVASGALAPEDLIPLGELVRGVTVAAEGRPRLFKSTGMAWEDAVVAAAIAGHAASA